ncbi:MAG: DUF3458 domain-containing protein, partial [Gammaproteobacteria bacterium]|nr:DUF3458 domain-containing protein [Gammaproteobacteria bacterium]
GQAVTTEEFVSAMEDASKVDLTQFRRWYKQAGTPEITVKEHYDASKQTYSLELSQLTSATPGQEEKLPFHIPVKIGLTNKNSASLLVQEDSTEDSVVLNLVKDKQHFEFKNINEKPVLSILQGYSAPVKLNFKREDEELAFCMAHEKDDFSRWEAGQQLSSRLILSLIESIKSGGELTLPDYYIDACQKILTNQTLDKALIARAITLPSAMYIGEMLPVIEVDAIHQAREFIYAQLAKALKSDLLQVYSDNAQTKYSLSPTAMGERFLRNQALSYLMYLGAQGETLAKHLFQSADNMTDQMAAFRSLVHHETVSSEEVIAQFYQQWQKDNLVMDKWFTVQATAPYLLRDASDTSTTTLVTTRIDQLFKHDDFDIKNPNRVRALLGAFCSANPLCFHDSSGFGYQLLGQYIETINSINPQIASRLCVPLTRWKRYDDVRQKLMKSQLQRLIALPTLSNDVTELVEKSLK